MFASGREPCRGLSKVEDSQSDSTWELWGDRGKGDGGRGDGSISYILYSALCVGEGRGVHNFYAGVSCNKCLMYEDHT